MAVPKKKTSKSRKNARKSIWKNKVKRNVILAISLGRSVEKGSKFVFP
uniref:Large ribosomal subunit protein bL32c n=1 Tax=Euglenaformis proxima TaxID=299110 RepID=A0A023HHS2_9EUGL|nr:ribosomal protein L32 [Euglenaformis proxima]AGL12026.1 ribosomal protein L32 [Euglenaformis proxima]